MSRVQAGPLCSDLRRKKRRSAAKMLAAKNRIRDALYVLEEAANDISIAYEAAGMTDAQRDANKIVNALRDKNIFTIDGINIFEDLLSSFNRLPEDY